MKTEEDEAFDELAKRQGAWGGGFKAKQAMAKARVEDDDDIQDYKRSWAGLTDEELKKIWYDMKHLIGWYSFQESAQAVEQLLKKKNT